MSLRRRILIVNPFGIGDVLFSTPLIRAIRRAFPSAFLAYLCNRRTDEILRRNPNLDELFIYEKDEVVSLFKQNMRAGLQHVLALLGRIRRRRFDVAIDLSLGERYSFLLALLGVPRRIGFDFRRRGRFLTHRFAMEGYQGRHVVEYYAQLLGMIGIRLLDRALELSADDDDARAAGQRLAQLRDGPGQRVIGLVPAGGMSWGPHAHFRRWSKEGFVQVGRRLRQRHNAVILVFGESSDQAVCEEIAGAIGPSAVNLSGQTSLGQFISLIANCDLVIANDGGPVHIAASQGVRTVSIFGPVDPDVYGPYPRTPRHRILYNPQLLCRPCYHQFKLPPCPYERACLTTVDADTVLAACDEVLAELKETDVVATAA